MARHADYERLPSTSSHESLRIRLWSSPRSVDVGQFADVVDCNIPLATAKFAFPGQEALNDLRTAVALLHPCLPDIEVRHMRRVWNPVEVNSTESCHQRVFVGAVEDDLKDFQTVDTVPLIPLVDLADLDPILASKCLDRRAGPQASMAKPRRMLGERSGAE